MFTGLIEAVCKVEGLSRQAGPDTASLTIDLGGLARGAGIGDSIAVNGVCLTVARLNGNLATFELSSETLAKSSLTGLKPSSAVNIERAMKPTDRFGGHFVQGHVDGIATIKQINRQGRFADIQFAAEPDLLSQMVLKGSIAVDGISLTIAALSESSLSVSLIPKTLENTTLNNAKTGDRVNVEIDIIVKAVKRLLESATGGLQKQTLTTEKLKQLGF